MQALDFAFGADGVMELFAMQSLEKILEQQLLKTTRRQLPSLQSMYAQTLSGV